MSKKVDSYRYRELVKMAKERTKKVFFEPLSPEEKEHTAKDWAEALKINDPEEQKIFMANMLIPDDDFITIYFNNGRSAKKTAEYYNVSQNIVITKAASLELYEKDEQKVLGDDEKDYFDYNFDEPIVAKVETAYDKTADAISKISQLLELNNSQEDIIANQGKTLDNKDEEIVKLNDENARKDGIIASLKEQIEEKDSVIEIQKKSLEEKEEEIKAYHVRIKELLTYKDNYERIINFLDKNVENSGKKPII